jgi:hypothetical protein
MKRVSGTECKGRERGEESKNMESKKRLAE